MNQKKEVELQFSQSRLLSTMGSDSEHKECKKFNGFYFPPNSEVSNNTSTKSDWNWKLNMAKTIATFTSKIQIEINMV